MMKNSKFNLTKALFITLILLPEISHLAMATSMSEARQGALDFGNIYKNSASTVITEENKQNTPGYTTDNPEQTKYYSGADMSADIENKIATSDEGKLMTQSLPNRPKVEVSLDDPFLNYARQIETTPQTADEVINMFVGNYEQCAPIDIAATDSETRTCDFYEEREGGSCLVNQIVEVEAIYNYECNKTRNSRDKTCTKTPTLTCLAFNNNCSTAQIFTVTNGNGIYSYPNLSINIPRQGGSCTTLTKTMTFTIFDVSQISQFTFTNISYDDYASVKVNGTYLYNDVPATIPRGCERGRTWGASPNINVIPYLVNGNNQIEVRVLVGGMGQVYSSFVVQQKCCTSWQENWGEVCP